MLRLTLVALTRKSGGHGKHHDDIEKYRMSHSHHHDN